MTKNLSAFGVIGLGVMGSSLSLNIAGKGYPISIYNRLAPGEEKMVSNALNRKTDKMKMQGFTDLDEFVNSLEQPRKILMMIKAGSAIDKVIEALQPLLSEGDILIDGGNSLFSDTKNRCRALIKKGVHYMGCGISGGEVGALTGPSLMVGGDKEAYNEVAEILESIAAKDKNGIACCTYISKDGSGHYVKMVHNGIEYAEMQLLAELYALLKINYSNSEIAEIFRSWNTTDLESYLLEITANILTKREGDDYILDKILDKAGNKGTGSWSSKVALDLGSVNTMMTSSVFARYISSFKSLRIALSSKVKRKRGSRTIAIKDLEKAYRFGRIINHYQGFELIKKGASEFSWDVDCSEIARIWTNGCIIRSKLMEASVSYLKGNKTYFDNKDILTILKENESSIKTLLNYGIDHSVSLSAFYSAYNFWLSITTERLPAHLIQAQRDYFGSHTYQIVGHSEDEYFHTNWTDS